MHGDVATFIVFKIRSLRHKTDMLPRAVKIENGIARFDLVSQDISFSFTRFSHIRFIHFYRTRSLFTDHELNTIDFARTTKTKEARESLVMLAQGIHNRYVEVGLDDVVFMK